MKVAVNLLTLLTLLLPTAVTAINAPSSNNSNEDSLAAFQRIKKHYYFVSNRQSELGEIDLYKIRTHQQALTACIVKGRFEVPHRPNQKRARIMVHTLHNDELVGLYNTNANGDYLMVLMPNVKYRLVVNTPGYDTLSAVVEVPFYANSDAYAEVSKQQIKLQQNPETGATLLDVKNWFVEAEERTLFLLTVYKDTTNEPSFLEFHDAESVPFEHNSANYSNVNELLKKEAELARKKPAQAAKAYEKGDYVNAYRLYAQLLAINANDAVASYRCGISLFHLGARKNKAIPYLEAAAKSSETPTDVYYYLGYAYHQKSFFDQALVALHTFKQKAPQKAIEALQVNQLIAYAKNGQQLMQQQLQLEVENRTPIALKTLPKGYPYPTANAVMKKTAFFTSPVDEESTGQLLMCQRPEVTVQASYGMEGQQLDLYFNRLIGHEQWGLSQLLSNQINTPYDENYPYLSADGNTLYFSSKGHNSMGGYDIFKCVREHANAPWSAPENMGYPINSTYDDILFVPGEEGERAWFASNRRNDAGNYQLYQIKMPKPPLPLAVIKGHFMTLDAANNRTATISAYNLYNDELAGVYNTNTSNGNYLMALMPGVKYELIVACDGFEEHFAKIEVPYQTEAFTLRQELRLKKEQSFEVLEVKNYFTALEAATVPDAYDNPFEGTKEKVVAIAKPPQIRRHQRSPEEAARDREMIARAKQFFEDEAWSDAIDVYKKLEVVVELDAANNYRYGVSLFHHEFDKGWAVSCLEKAAQHPETPGDVFHYLGQSYLHTYRFGKAIIALEQYKAKTSLSKADIAAINEQITMCKNGRKMVGSPKAVEVLDRKSFAYEGIHNAFNSLDFAGRVLLTPEDLKSSNDKKNNYRSTLFLSQNRTAMYYASYGETNGSGKDIYKMLKLPDGNWGLPQKLGAHINTPGDEEYPYITPDGKTLFFSSKGHNSMGGYDVFRSEWDENTQKWSTPVNIGAPVNSPFDDIFFVY